MADRITYEQRVAISDAIYKALREYDYQKRSARNLRAALGGREPRIKRGTGRAALTAYLTMAVTAALAEADDD